MPQGTLKLRLKGRQEDSKVQQQKGTVKEASPEMGDEALALAKCIVPFVRILHLHALVQWP